MFISEKSSKFAVKTSLRTLQKFNFMAERKEKTLQRVTLKEMYDIFASDIYKEYREQRGLVVKNYGGMDFITIDKNTEVDGLVYYASEPLLLGHIAAEKCMREGYETIPWDNYHVSDINECMNLFYKWVHPLFWIDPISMETMVSESRIAKEEYDPTRIPDVIDYCKYIEGYRLLKFADNPPLCDDDAIANYGYRKGMHIWITLTCNFEALMEMILDGEDISLLNEKVIPYDAASLRKNLTYIAERRGGKCAAELLRTLQNEWSTMELWKPSFDKMSNDGLEYFKNILFNDFEDLLKGWESEDEIIERVEKRRGPRRNILFVKDKQEDEKRTAIEAERFIKFKTKHHWGKKKLTTEKGNKHLCEIASFYMQWWNNGYGVLPPSSTSGPAITRFLKEKCEIEFEVNEKTFSNAIRDMIKKKADEVKAKDYKPSEIDKEVQTYFNESN